MTTTCQEYFQSRKCGRVAVAYYVNSHNTVKPVCDGHLAMFQAWHKGKAEIGPIGDLLHPDPAMAWKEKQEAVT